jgi:hypothetical protein
MHNISKQKYGYQLTFGGTIDLDEITRWREKSRVALVGAPKSFGVLIDMRGLGPGGLRPEAQPVMVEGQELYRKAGMVRSCVVLQSATVTMQFQRLARESGIDSYERYINAAAQPDWQAKAIAWIESRTEPGF